MLAEAGLAVEPELVDRVAAVFARRQRVVVAAVADVAQHQLGRARSRRCRGSPARAQRARPGERARIEAGRQLQALLDLARAARRAQGVARIGLRLDADPLVDRPLAEPLQVLAATEPEALDRRDLGGGFEQRHRGDAQRLERRLVAHRLAARRSVGDRSATPAGAKGRPSGRHSMPSKRVSTGPGSTSATETARAPSKRIRIATDSSRATSVTEPMRRVFDRPVVEMPSCGTPQSGPTRGNSTNSSAITGAPSSAVRAARPPAWRRLGWPDRHVRQHERGQQAPDRDHHRHRDGERLRVEEVGEDDEEAEEEDDEGVAPGAQLQRLQRHQRDREGDPRLLAEQACRSSSR